MSTTQLTDERLRTWLIDQSDCERLCIAVLATQPNYTNVQPRRPVGGPDGGRDIEALYKDQNLVWGAVGFRHKANDSAEDKKWVKNKYKNDLEAARKHNSDLRGFVFFTNVDLTPGEVAELEDLARSLDFTFTDIFYRERLRIALDQPVGLAFRYQYLNIAMEPAEQQAFFAQWGSQFDKSLHEGFDVIDLKLNRLEFLNECLKPLKRVRLIIQLRQAYAPSYLGHFRFLARFTDLYQTEPFPEFLVGGCDAYGTWHSGGISRQTADVRSLSWSENPREIIQNTIVGQTAYEVNQLEAFASIQKLGYLPAMTRDGSFKTLGSLEDLFLRIYMTNSLFEQLNRIALIVNDYILVDELADNVYIENASNPIPWLEEVPIDQAGAPWVNVVCRTGWNLAFSRNTPMKL